MKKIFLILLVSFIVTGCGCVKVSDNDANKDNSSHNIYYYKYDFSTPELSTNVFKINTESLNETLLLNTKSSIFMIQYEGDKLYAIIDNQVGYIDDKVNIITKDDYVARYFSKDNKIYFGKDNSNASDNIFESFAMADNKNNQSNIHQMGISNLVVDDYIYYKPNSGSEVNNLLQYKLDGTDKKVIYNGNFGLLTLGESYIYFTNYADNNSLYQVKKDGSNAKKIVEGSLTFDFFNVNPINGEYKLATIGDNLYYINSLDGYKLYKYDGTNTMITENPVKAVKAYDDKLFVIYKNKSGLFELNADGTEIKQILSTSPDEYEID